MKYRGTAIIACLECGVWLESESPDDDGKWDNDYIYHIDCECGYTNEFQPDGSIVGKPGSYYDQFKDDVDDDNNETLERSNTMAKNITAQVLGGEAQIGLQAANVGEIKQQLGVPNHSASVNGQPADNSTVLSDYQFVSLSPAVKGGC